MSEWLIFELDTREKPWPHVTCFIFHFSQTTVCHTTAMCIHELVLFFRSHLLKNMNSCLYVEDKHSQNIWTFLIAAREIQVCANIPFLSSCIKTLNISHMFGIKEERLRNEPEVLKKSWQQLQKRDDMENVWSLKLLIYWHKLDWICLHDINRINKSQEGIINTASDSQKGDRRKIPRQFHPGEAAEVTNHCRYMCQDRS